MITPGDLKPERRPYRPYGAAQQLLYDRSPEVVLSGPAGTGKSRGCMEKIHLCCEKYATCRWLICRKTRASLTESGLVTYEEKVVPSGHPALEGASRGMRQAYHYPNGSTVVVGGLDKPTKIMSTEYDGIYVQEAIELAEDDWESLTTRLRNGVMPYQQLIADTNPDAPSHWLKKRADAGRTLLLESRHEDNPTLWDAGRRAWTPAGAVYLSKLDALTGPRKLRLRYGRWVQAEGVVYDGWDAAVHLIDPFPIPRDWPRFWAIDFGYTNPFVCYDDQTEILTPGGWCLFRDLLRAQPVAAVDPESRALRWEVPTAYIDQPYEGPMVCSDPRREGACFSVTPNHRMLVESRKTGNWRLVRADELPAGSSIPVGWEPCGDVPDEMFQVPRGAGARPNRPAPAPLSRIAFARLVGLIIAEGCLHQSGSRSHPSKYVRISQSRHVEAVRAALTATGWRWSEFRNSNGVIDFSIGSADLYDFLAEYSGEAGSHKKSVPAFLFGWGRSCLQALLDGLMVGDGSPRLRNDDGVVCSSMRYSTTSRRLADDVQRLACLLGMPTVIQETSRTTGYSNPATPTYFTVRFHCSRRAAVERLPLQTRHYSGRVYCVTVPSGLLVVRRNGRPMICGNCQWWALDPDGRLYLYREIYQTRRLVEDHARRILEASGALTDGIEKWLPSTADPRPRAVVCDHDAEDRATLERHAGMATTAAVKDVSPGIQAVASRLKLAGDGKPRLFVFRNALYDRDASLEEAKKPTCTAEEVDGYVWDLSANRKRGEEPVKDCDHGMDCMRYLVAYVDGDGTADPGMPMTVGRRAQ